MGLSAGAIYVSEPGIGNDVATHLGLLEAGGAPLEHTERGFEVGEGVRIGLVEGRWTVILGSPEAFLPRIQDLSSKLSEQSQGRKVFFWYTQSAVGGAMFELHKNGVLQRRWVEAEGQVFEDIGEPIPEEAGLVDCAHHEGGPLHSESSVLELAAKVTGISVDQHFEMVGPVYAAAP